MHSITHQLQVEFHPTPWSTPHVSPLTQLIGMLRLYMFVFGDFMFPKRSKPHEMKSTNRSTLVPCSATDLTNWTNRCRNSFGHTRRFDGNIKGFKRTHSCPTCPEAYADPLIVLLYASFSDASHIFRSYFHTVKCHQQWVTEAASYHGTTASTTSMPRRAK